MAHEVVMPKMGESIVEGTILDWKKSEGDFIQKDEILLEISTDKVDSEIPSPVEGSIIQILFKKGDTVEVGKVIAIVGDEGESVSVIDKKEESAKQDESSFEKETLGNEDRVKAGLVEHKQMPSQEKNQSNRFYSPLVRSIAKRESINNQELELIKGTGRGGRVNKADILGYINQKRTSVDYSIETPKPNVIETPKISDSTSQVQEMDNVRKRISEHMIHSQKTSAHVYSTVEIDMTNLLKVKNEYAEKYYQKHSIKLTVTSLIIDACIKALHDFPLLNTSIDD